MEPLLCVNHNSSQPVTTPDTITQLEWLIKLAAVWQLLLGMEDEGTPPTMIRVDIRPNKIVANLFTFTTGA
jgi:hypothetical protein